MRKSIFDDRYVRLVNHLKRKRLARGFTQAEMAGRMGWPRTLVSKVEILERRIDVLELFDMYKVLGLSLRDAQRILDDQQ